MASAEAVAKAAELYVQARMGEGKYEVVSCYESEDYANMYEIAVKLKGNTRAKVETIMAPVPVLEKIADENLDIDHLTGKKPLPEQVRAEIKDQFGTGFEDLFESRE